MNYFEKLPHDIKSYLSVNKSAEKPIRSGICYDDYFCMTEDAAVVGHVFLGVLGLCITVVGIVLSVLVLPVVSLMGIRSSATSYLAVIAVTDVCHLIVSLILTVVLQISGPSVHAQRVMYRHFTAYFVPLGHPIRLICQLLSAVLLLAFMLDRYVYMKHENKSRSNAQDEAIHYTKRSTAWKIIIAIITACVLVKLPHFLLLRVVDNKAAGGGISILFNPLSSRWMFVVDAVINWVLYALYLIVVLLLLNQLLKKRALPITSKEKLFQVSLTQRYRRRERICFVIALVLGLLTLLLKLPLIVGTAIVMRDLMQHSKKVHENTLNCEQIERLAEMVFVVLKPIVYLALGVHFRKALCDMIGLWVRPGRYEELHVSGGMGKKVWLHKDGHDTSTALKRNDTVNSFLQHGTDQYEHHCRAGSGKVASYTSSSGNIEQLAKDFVKTRGGHSSSYSSKSNEANYVASISSVDTTSGIESQYATPIL